jgi:hypothetical protein
MVRAPHHVVDTDGVSQANADGVLLEAQHDVAAEEVAREHAVLKPVNRLAVALAVCVVHGGEHVGLTFADWSTPAIPSGSQGALGAFDRTEEELRFALTEIGFYFIVNHGVPSGQIREVFRQAARFHAQPLETKLDIKLDKHSATCR